MHLDGGGKVLECENPQHRALIGCNLFPEVPAFQGAAHLPLRFMQFLRSGEDACEIHCTVHAAESQSHVRLFFWRVCADLVIARITSRDL